MTTLTSTPSADGFHMPAEWAPHSQTWMVWPQRPDNWRLGGKPAQAAFTAVAKAIAEFEPVTIGVSAEQYENACARLDQANIRVVEITSDDAWVRDTGPTFVINDQGDVRGVDWTFNAWGGFDGGLYWPWLRDDQVARKILEIERYPRYRTEGFVLEGGAIHVDGEGTLLTTEECLLNQNRNPQLSRADIEAQLRSHLGIDRVIWLPNGLFNDETDGHVDNFCCFVRPGEVVLQWTDNRDDPQWEIYQEAYDILRSTRDSRGRELIVHKLPQPDVLEWTAEEAEGLDQQDSTHTSQAGTQICASYINYYAGNSSIVVPLFGDRNDQAALATLAELFPQHKIVGIENSREILLGGGNVACITMPQYAGKGV